MPGRATARPRSGLVGWAAAWAVLERVRDAELRDLLTELTRTAGVRGAPGLEYMAASLRWYAGAGEAPVPRMALSGPEASFIQGRAQNLLGAFVGDPRLPRMRLRSRAAA